MHVLWTIVLASLIEFVGDSQFKFYARTGNRNNLAVGLLVYCVMIYFIIQALKKSNTAYMNLGWDGISALVGTILAMVLLHENLSNRVQLSGAALIIVGIAALSYGKVPV